MGMATVAITFEDAGPAGSPLRARTAQESACRKTPASSRRVLNNQLDSESGPSGLATGERLAERSLSIDRLHAGGRKRGSNDCSRRINVAPDLAIVPTDGRPSLLPAPCFWVAAACMMRQSRELETTGRTRTTQPQPHHRATAEYGE
jgi:hypothetical protein